MENQCSLLFGNSMMDILVKGLVLIINNYMIIKTILLGLA